MNKPYRLIKRRLALILVLLFSIESFAAVVGDNDGAAFITKAEFDSMKNDFQSQLDRYNSSLDNKIDGAIVAYLSGIGIQSKVELKNLVDNYQDMKWVNTYKVYGVWRKWSSFTSKTEKITNDWYVPELNEKRLGLRGDSGNTALYDPMYVTDGYGVLALDLAPQQLHNGLTIGARNLGETRNYHAPTLYLRFDKDAASGRYFLQSSPYRNAYTLMNVQYFNVHNAVGASNWYLNRERVAIFDFDQEPVLEFYDTSGRQVYNCKFYWEQVGYQKTSGWSRPTFDNFQFPYMWLDDTAYTKSGEERWKEFQDKNPNGMISSSVNSMCDGYYERGVTYQLLDKNTQSQQDDYLHKMMLGKDNGTIVNAGYAITTNGSQSLDFSLATDSVLGDFKVSKANFSNVLYKDVNSLSDKRAQFYYTPTVTIPVSLQLPVWPSLALKSINSRYFSYENAPLTLGQGLPIAKNISSNGFLHINATYETKRIISTYTSKGIALDVADRTFTDNGVKYFEGYDDDVDPNRTTSTFKSLHNVTVNNTAKTLKLTIPVKKEDNVWLRIAPDTTDGGYYATLKDLKVTLVSQ